MCTTRKMMTSAVAVLVLALLAAVMAFPQAAFAASSVEKEMLNFTTNYDFSKNVPQKDDPVPDLSFTLSGEYADPAQHPGGPVTYAGGQWEVLEGGSWIHNTDVTFEQNRTYRYELAVTSSWGFTASGNIVYVDDREWVVADMDTVDGHVLTHVVSPNFTISDKYDIGQATASELGPAECIFLDSAPEPQVALTYRGRTLARGADYDVSYSGNGASDIGHEATITLTGKGDYSGAKTVKFAVGQADLSTSDCVVTLSQGPYPYAGDDVEPGVTVTYLGRELTKGVHYEVSYEDNDYVGTARVEVTGKGNVANSKTVTFEITGPAKSGTCGGSAAWVYDDAAQTLSISGTGAMASYDFANGVFPPWFKAYTNEHWNISRIVVDERITSIGDGAFVGLSPIELTLPESLKSIGGYVFYVGSCPSELYVPRSVVSINMHSMIGVQMDMSAQTVTMSGVMYGYPTYAVTTYLDGAEAAMRSLFESTPFTFTGNALKFVDVDITTADIMLDKTSYTSTGSALTPAVTVRKDGKTLVKGADYTVAYASNVNAGTATATVTGAGIYKGTVEKAFTINPAPEPAPSDPGSSGSTPASSTTSTTSSSSTSTSGSSTSNTTNVSNSTNITNVTNNTKTAAAPAKKASKKKNTMTVKSKSKKVKYSKLKKKAQAVKPITVKKAKGKVTYKVTKWTTKSAKKYFKVNKKTGKVTVKKGAPKKTYKFKVKVKAAGNNSYKSASQTVKVTVKVK